MAETTITRQLDHLELLIKRIIENKAESGDYLKQFHELVYSLRVGSRVMSVYEAKLLDLQIAAANLAKFEKEERRQQDKADKVGPGPVRHCDLPREELARHDGKVSTFYAFWGRITRQLIHRADIEEDTKITRLAGVVSNLDANIIIGSGIVQAIWYLENKYASPHAIRDYIGESIAPLRMRNENDVEGARKLADNLRVAIEVTKAVTTPAPELKVHLFNTVLAGIPVSVRREFRSKYPSCESEPQELLNHLEEVITILLADKVAFTSIGGVKDKQMMMERSCYTCGKTGHISKQCRPPMTPCPICKQTGHWARSCSFNKGTPSRRYPWAPPVCKVETWKPRASKPRCEVKVGEATFSGVIDTGSDITILPASAVKTDAPVKPFTMADGKSTLWTRGPTDVNFTMAGETFKQPVYVHEQLDGLIGLDVLTKHEAVIDVAKNEVTFKKPPLKDDQPEEADPSDGEVALVDEDDKWQKLVQEEYGDLLEGIGKTDVIEHRIDTGDNKPIAIPNRRIPVNYMDAVADHVRELLGQDVIEESQSEWRFPLVIINKKDNTIRMTVDLRELNHITVKDTFPMPRVDEFFEKVNKARVFSRMDLRKGYYQILMREEDRPKTAFAFKGKLYQFKRMPFGACNAPQTFQRLMERVLGDLPFVFIYLDDVLIFSENEEEHMEMLKQVLDRLRDAGLTLNGEKCLFGKDEVEFLGFKIKDGKRSPIDQKCQIMADFPVPDTPTKLRGFLGLANFYRNFVPDFADLAAPLFEACNKKYKKNKLVWTDECKESFCKLKERFRDKPTTHLPDLDKPFVVTSDASDMATGAVLSQIIDGERKIVDFMSKMFSSAERRYSTIEREATAILWAIEKWDHYLRGGEFTVETDHKPLKWLLSMKETKTKLGRLALKLQEYKIKGIEYVKGEDNEMADALSRIEVGLLSAAPGAPTELLRRIMRADPNRFKEIDGRIYLVEGESKRLCIDSLDEVRQILKLLHDDEGHFAEYKTAAAIRQRFYWPNWKKDLKWYLKQCYDCQSKKDNREPFKEELVPLESKEVLERVHVDVCGPLCESSGNKYIVVLQDAFSKWLEAKAIPDARAATIMDWLRQEVFSRFGVPKMITTDSGTQFDCKEFKKFCQDRGIEHHITSLYHHQGNGLVERAIRTIEEMLRVTCKDQKDWSHHIPDCVSGYNSRKHMTTEVTPHSLMFGREAATKVDRIFQLEPPIIDTEMNRAFATAKRDSNTKKTKQMYDRKKKPAQLKKGDLVLWRVMEQGVGKSKKLNRRWRGPFRVEEVLRPKAKLFDKDGKQKTIHMNHLKPIKTSVPLDEFRGRGRPRIQRGRSKNDGTDDRQQ